MTPMTDAEKITNYDSLKAFANHQTKILSDQGEKLKSVENLINSDIYDKYDDWFMVRDVLKKILKIYDPTKCLMCDNKDYTWFEVLRDTCGIAEPREAINSLCEVHQQIAREQMDVTR